MATFSYQALDERGKKVRGVIEGDSERHARAQLRSRQLKPIDIKANKQALAGAKISGTGFKFSFGGPSLGHKDVALITRQLSSLVQSGLPLDEVLAAAAKQSRKPAIKSIILQVRSRVLEGLSLAQAMSEMPKVFDNLYRAMIRAGESSGYLGPVLEQLAEYTERSQETKQRIKSAMVYPIVMVVVAVSVVTLLMVQVVPSLTSLFERGGKELPLLTEVLINTSNFLIAYGVYLVIAIVALFVFLHRWLQDPKRREKWHAVQLKLPLMGEFISQAETARYAGTLGLLAKSGVPLLDGLRIASQVLTNTRLRGATEEVAAAVQEGTSLNRALDQVDVFPPLLVQMVASGEANGKLDEQLVHVAANQERELKYSIDGLMSLLEPAMILFMAFMVGLIVMAILLPIFDLNKLTG